MADLLEERLAICKQCPLWKVDDFYGPVCNSAKYIAPDGKESSYFKKAGYVKGCGCRLQHKASNPMNHCIVKK